MIPVAHVAHMVTGRVRIKVPSRRGDVEYFTVLYEELLDYPALVDVRVNPGTGSIIINHDAPSLEQLKSFAEEMQLFNLERTDYKPEVLLERVSLSLKGIDEGIKKYTGGDIDFRSVVFIILIGVAIKQLTRGHVVGPASTLIWQALGMILSTKITKK